jgi:hypothetical protein
MERMERVATFRFPESSLRSLRAREENSGTVRQGWGFKSKRRDSQCRFVTVSSAGDIPLLAGIVRRDCSPKKMHRADSEMTEMEGLFSEEFTIHSQRNTAFVL